MRVLVVSAIMIAILTVALFASAGRFDLPFFWAYLGVFVLVVLIGRAVMDPELVKERMRPGPGGTDRYLRALATPCLAVHLVVAGLDVGRFHWSQAMPASVQAAGWIGFVLALSLSMGAVSVNRFFSPVVRIQSERGHHVVTAGPYRFIRHPGYAATLLIVPSSGLALGSWWAVLPLVPVFALILRRTIVEDRFLKQNLDGYASYAQRVRYRILPRIW